MDGINISEFYIDASGVSHGFLYDLVTSNWTTLDDPLSGQGTYAERISGGNTVGAYIDSSGLTHGFVYNVGSKAWTTLDDPLAGPSTVAFNISDTKIVGGYVDTNDNAHGFLYDLVTSNWTTLDDPRAGPGSFGVGGTSVLGIADASIAGYYIHTNGVFQGFLATLRPQLTITNSGNALTVAWPYWNNPSLGWTLQKNSDLTTTNWSPSAAIVSNNGTNNFVTITAPPGNSFLRLRQQ